MSQDRYYVALYDPETGGMTLKPKWRLNEPGFARTQGYGGSLVVGASGNVREQMERHNKAEAERRAKLKDDAA